MTSITVEEIQRDFSTYLRLVRDGARLLILESNRPIAELRPIPGQQPADVPEQTTLEPELQKVYSELRKRSERQSNRFQKICAAQLMSNSDKGFAQPSTKWCI